MRNCRLKYKGKEYDLIRGTLLSEFLRREGVAVSMPCGGMGRCGKCGVRFISGVPAPTSADRRFFSEDDINSGYRLACRAVILEDAEIEELSPVGDEPAVQGEDELPEDAFHKCRIAVDLGTTTIAAALVDVPNGGRILRKATTMNHQRSYGADVISRIKAANEGCAKALRDAVITDILDVMGKLFEGANGDVSEIVIAGNTTMLHLLTGDSCEGLGRAPYKPVRLSYPVMKFDELFGSSDVPFDASSCVCRLMPGISAFVGADIVSGMYELSFHEIPEGKTYMLIDLGTNGEMAVADSRKVTVCSTAAGPVFEGGGISCGMAGVTGAIEHVKIDSKEAGAVCKTIGDGKPVGICGSGVLELVSELRRTEIVDETGLLEDQYFDEGFILYKEGDERISFSQNDIRAVQLAKAAIRSGIDTLLDEHGCSPKDVDRVYIAGGFSEHLNVDMIRYLKILPGEFYGEGITECAGNTSLKGCVKALCDRYFEEKTAAVVLASKEIPLADADTFEESFFDAMNL